MVSRVMTDSYRAAKAVLDETAKPKEAATKYKVALSTVYLTASKFRPYTAANRKKLSKLIEP